MNYINLRSLAYANCAEYVRLHKTYTIGMCMHVIGYLGHTDSCLQNQPCAHSAMPAIGLLCTMKNAIC